MFTFRVGDKVRVVGNTYHFEGAKDAEGVVSVVSKFNPSSVQVRLTKSAREDSPLGTGNDLLRTYASYDLELIERSTYEVGDRVVLNESGSIGLKGSYSCPGHKLMTAGRKGTVNTIINVCSIRVRFDEYPYTNGSVEGWNLDTHNVNPITTTEEKSKVTATATVTENTPTATTPTATTPTATTPTATTGIKNNLVPPVQTLQQALNAKLVGRQIVCVDGSVKGSQSSKTVYKESLVIRSIEVNEDRRTVNILHTHGRLYVVKVNEIKYHSIISDFLDLTSDDFAHSICLG